MSLEQRAMVMQEKPIIISEYVQEKHDSFRDIYMQIHGVSADFGYFEQCCSAHLQRRIVFFMAEVSDCADEKSAAAASVAGYGLLHRVPKYPFYQRQGIAEIQDLNVLPDYRCRGIATKMIAYCEDLERRKGADEIGISVGVSHRFGAAQRLYAKLGYVPDGNGVTYDRAGVSFGELKPVDDQLCLMMIKSLH